MILFSYLVMVRPGVSGAGGLLGFDSNRQV